jgi:hypothetical protein
MNTKLIYKIYFMLLFILLTGYLHSETHIIQFGGTFGTAYSPNTLNVNVNDTIIWQGNFSFHPLSSTNIPAGASSWHSASGSEFMYVVLVAGNYEYRCDAHFQNGMVGSFTAEVTTGISRQLSSKPSAFNLEQNYPNPFNPETKIVFSIPETQSVRLNVFNVLGKEVAVLADEIKPPGKYEVSFNASDYGLTSGIYIYQLRSGNKLATKKFTILK